VGTAVLFPAFTLDKTSAAPGRPDENCGVLAGSEGRNVLRGHPISEEAAMGDRLQRLKGKANEGAGKAREAAGYQTGRPTTEMRGGAQAVKGKTQQAVGRARRAVKKKTG
jgi:uncharacterized protein YjbJ (UPF0337 family)